MIAFLIINLGVDSFSSGDIKVKSVSDFGNLVFLVRLSPIIKKESYETAL